MRTERYKNRVYHNHCATVAKRRRSIAAAVRARSAFQHTMPHAEYWSAQEAAKSSDIPYSAKPKPPWA